MNRPPHPAQHLIEYREKNHGDPSRLSLATYDLAAAYPELSGRAIGLVRKVGRYYGLERCWEFAALHPTDILALRNVGHDTLRIIQRWLAAAALCSWPQSLPTAARYEDRSARRRLIAERLDAIEQALDPGPAGDEPDDEALEPGEPDKAQDWLPVEYLQGLRHEPEPEPTGDMHRKCSEPEHDPETEPEGPGPDVPPARIPNRHLYTATHCPVCDRIDLGDTYVVVDGLAVCWECFVNQGFARSLYTLRAQLLQKATA